MKISLKSENVYQGGIYIGRFSIDTKSALSYDYITCKVKGTIFTPGLKITVLESVYKILEFKDNEAILKFTIPKESPPSLVDEKHKICYEISLFVYSGLEKIQLRFPFDVGSSYIFDRNILYKIIIADDMLRTNDLYSTPFQTVIDKMRKFDTGIVDKNTSLVEIAKEKAKKINKADILQNIIKTEKNGDIWFYCDDSTIPIENQKHTIDVNCENKVFATLKYCKYIKEKGFIEATFYSDVKEIKIELVKKINEELDKTTELFIGGLKGCFFRVCEFDIPEDVSFTFKSNYFEINFFLIIHIDELSFKLPVILLNRNSNIKTLSYS
ncbi:hypothetical protein NGRA_0179 [Nosema granulosis]|uniref:Uncharacterized protein n=1 Tax=Nosema granulosis TaxID=83296 RepID=A0A9P6L0A0_9MICR|nr:hypothetical protein NGRA_0179 [Nosema granulosis]